jgi:hypothetical protein
LALQQPNINQLYMLAKEHAMLESMLRWMLEPNLAPVSLLLCKTRLQQLARTALEWTAAYNAHANMMERSVITDPLCFSSSYPNPSPHLFMSFWYQVELPPYYIHVALLAT